MRTVGDPLRTVVGRPRAVPTRVVGPTTVTAA